METVAKFLSTLFNSRDQAHIFHLQTSSYAAHKALNKYYDEIVDLVDTYAETYKVVTVLFVVIHHRSNILKVMKY